MDDTPSKRELLGAEQFTPKLLHDFLSDLEATTRSSQVWHRLVALGRSVDLPYIDFIAASGFAGWRPVLFVRTSYDSDWLTDLNKDPQNHEWSTFRSHALDHLTPIMVGLEFADSHGPVPEARRRVLDLAAQHGMRAGFSVPLRIHAPPQSAMISFSGNHSRAAMLDLLRQHGWTLNVAAMVAHQRYMTHFTNEFFERNEITEKQRELLEMVGRGLQDKQIANELGISISALRQRMQSMMAKAGLRNRAEMAALAMCAGLLPDPQFLRNQQEVLVEMDDAGVRIWKP